MEMEKTNNSQNSVPQSPSQSAHVRSVFALLIAAVFLDVIDFSIVQIALPTIRDQFPVSLPEIQWIVGAYGLTLAGFLLLSGRAGDIYGQKRLFIFGVALFTVASMAGGLAPSLIFLIVARAVQGIGAAISTVTSLAMFTIIFPEGNRRNKALGIVVAVLSAGFAAGTLAGGVLTEFFGWRSVMFVNVPIGILTVIFSSKYMPRTRGRLKNSHLDLLGGLAITSGILLFVYALTNAANVGFSSLETLLPLGLSILTLVGFVIIESRSEAPLLPPSFLRRGAILVANVLGLILATASGGLGFVLTIYMQQILGYSALSTGLAFFPAAMVFLFIGGWGSPRLVNRLGAKRVLLVSMILVVLGNAFLTQISVHGNFLSVMPGMILWSMGASIGFPALYIVALTGTKPGEEGLASGLITTSQRVGFPLGLAFLLTVASLVSPYADPNTSAATIVAGFRYAFVAATALSVLGLTIVFKIKSEKTHENRNAVGITA